MKLKDALAAFDRPSMGLSCLTCKLLAELDKDDRATLIDMLADRSLSNMSISKVLDAAGHKVGSSSISRHRAGGCKGTGA